MSLRPPMPYAGGKQAIAGRIAALLPQHEHYVEPFAGALSVLLAKPASKIETANDLNQHLVTFWRVLRDRPDDLARVCALTPHSRRELQAAVGHLYGPGGGGDGDELEHARCVWVVLTQRRAACLHPSKAAGWRFVQGGGRMALGRYLDGYVERLHAAASRLRRVSLECRPAMDLIVDYGRHANVCLYVDPPYLGETRPNSTRLYAHEMTSTEDHAELLDALTACPAAVVLSGYDHPLYADRLTGWEVRRFPALSQDSTSRVEVVWMNRPGAASLF